MPITARSIDRAERRLKNLNYFKSVKITNEPGSAPDRIVINVDVVEQPTGEFAISGGYSTADGFLGEVSVGERNLLGRGQYARASVQYGQYAKGFEFGFVEPYLLGQRIALGLDLFGKERTANSYQSYDTRTLGGAVRLGFSLREDVSAAAALFALRAENQAARYPERLYQRPVPDHGRLDLRHQRRSLDSGSRRAVPGRGAHLDGRLHAAVQHARQQQERRPAA